MGSGRWMVDDGRWTVDYRPFHGHAINHFVTSRIKHMPYETFLPVYFLVLQSRHAINHVVASSSRNLDFDWPGGYFIYLQGSRCPPELFRRGNLEWSWFLTTAVHARSCSDKNILLVILQNIMIIGNHLKTFQKWCFPMMSHEPWNESLLDKLNWATFCTAMLLLEKKAKKKTCYLSLLAKP